MSPPTDEIFPCPVFEGSEKRISVTFAPAPRSAAAPPAAGLRALTRPQLDRLMALAACEIVSSRSTPAFDAYVLSESSLFVYPHRMVLKTCGTTKLLACLPHLVDLAQGLDLAPSRVKYSRASFLFPDKQPAPHHSFEHECADLKAAFASLGSISAYVLGDALNGLQWHVFVAGERPAAPDATVAHPTGADRPIYTFEVCMTGLHPVKAAQFVRGPDFVSSEHTTLTSGIASLVPGHAIDDYVFEPCGYSMNGMDGTAHSTVHITPEEGFSYASFELCGHCPDRATAAQLAARAAAVFHPRSMSVALSADTVSPGADAPGWGSAFQAPNGYDCHSAAYQEVKCGGYVAFFTLEEHPKGAAPPPALLPEAKTKVQENGSPRGVLKQFPSFKTLAAAAATAPPTAPATRRPSLEIGLTDSLGSSSDAASDSDRHSLSAGLDMLSFDEVVAINAAVPLKRGDAAAIDEHVRALIAAHQLEDNFYVVDLGAVQRLWHAWAQAMPRVHPHYAVKCNNDPALLAALAALGAGFDCASEAEVAQVLALGISPDRIVFANPCKRPADIRAAAKEGVMLSTFDTESELHKLQRWFPEARVLLRIRADDPTARCQLGNKFGAEEWEWEALFQAAHRLGVPVDGVSFHVGSGATNPESFRYAIEAARRAFNMGAAYGFHMYVLDIGGGFCGGRFGADGRVDLEGVPAAVNAALAAHFPEGTGVRVIAEPGRYFVESVATLACMVYGRRDRRDAAAAGALSAGVGAAAAAEQFDYWITDGLYGSMNCLLYDHAVLAPRALVDGDPGGPLHPSTIFGPTCDGLDTVVRDYPLPELSVGDWVAFPAMGAYTLCGASKFNGINAVDVPTFYIASTQP